MMRIQINRLIWIIWAWINIWLLVAQSCRTFGQGLINKIPNQEFVGGRPMALGETFVAIADDINSVNWNPAGLPSIHAIGFNSMHSNLFQSGIALNYLSLALPGPHRTGLAVDWLNIGYGDDELDFRKNKLNFSFGYQPIDRLSLGVNVKYMQFSAALDQLSQGAFHGWGLDFGVLYWLTNRLKFGMTMHDVTDTRFDGIDQPVYRRSIRLGASYQFANHLLMATDIDDRFHCGVEWRPFKQNFCLRAGVQKDFYTHETPILSAGFGLDLPIWGQRVQFDYAFTHSPTLPPTHRTSLAILIDLFPRLVAIRRVELKPIYASLYKFHNQYPVGELEVEYKGKTDLECTITVGLNKYGREMRKNIVLPANPNVKNVQKVNIMAAFADSIVNEFDDIPLVADVSISYLSGDRPKQEAVSQTFTLYRRNRIDWQYGVAQAAAFITPEDPSVTHFNRLALRNENSLKRQSALSEGITRAIQLFEAASNLGIRYEPDAYTPYRVSCRSLDNILYPAQLLVQKRGDCDDLTVLFASLLENQDIPAALVSVPGHIFLLFDSGIHPRRAFQCCCAEDCFIEFQDRLWIPLETTRVGHGFCYAWRVGADNLKKYCEQMEIVVVREAWGIYQPIAEAGVLLKATPGVLEQHLVQTLDSLKLMQQHYLDQLEQELAQFPDSASLRNKLAVIYAGLKAFDQAERHFRYLLIDGKLHAAVSNNLANLFMMRGLLDSAMVYYEQALKDAGGELADGILLNMALLHSAADDDSAAIDLFAQVIQHGNDCQRVANLLGISIEEDELAKAADLKPSKKVDKIVVKQLINKASAKTAKATPLKRESKKTIGTKGTLPQEQVDNIFYWAF